MASLAKAAPVPKPVPAAPKAAAALKAVAPAKKVIAPRSETLRAPAPSVPAFVRPSLEVSLHKTALQPAAAKPEPIPREKEASVPLLKKDLPVQVAPACRATA